MLNIIKLSKFCILNRSKTAYQIFIHMYAYLICTNISYIKIFLWTRFYAYWDGFTNSSLITKKLMYFLISNNCMYLICYADYHWYICIVYLLRLNLKVNKSFTFFFVSRSHKSVKMKDDTPVKPVSKWMSHFLVFLQVNIWISDCRDFFMYKKACLGTHLLYV